MATIASTVRITDMYSPIIRNMIRANQNIISSFNATQNASGNAFNMNAINTARSALANVETDFDDVERQIREAAEQQENLNQRINNGSNASGNFLGTITKIAGAIGAYMGVKKIFDLSDELTSTTARLGMMAREGENVADIQNMIFAAAERSRGSYSDTASTVAKLGILAKDAFGSTGEIIAFAEQMNKQFVIGGASVQEQTNAMYQLTQAMAAGRLQGDEFRSIMENAPTLAQAIADKMGKTTGELREMSSQGLITADVIKSALFSVADETEERFNNMPKTIGQVWTSIKNHALKAFQPVLKRINDVVNNPQFTAGVNNMINAIVALAGVALNAFETIGNIAAWIGDNWDSIAPIVYGVVAAFVAYNAVSMITNAILGIQAFAASVSAAASMMQAGGTFAATVAQHGLNAALWACPITWIIALIIALIVVFVIFTEQIVGAIWWLGALFKNIGLWIANVALGVWNTIKNIGQWFKNLGLSIWAIFQNIGFAIANFFLGIWESVKAIASNIATAFGNAWTWIQVQFWTLVDAIMMGLKSVAEFANKVLGWMGVNIDTSGLDFAKSKISELNSQYGEMQDIGAAWAAGSHTFEYKDVGESWANNPIDWGGSWNEGFNTFDTFQDGWGSDAYNSGAEIGAGLHDSIMGLIPSFGGDATDPTGGAYELGNYLDGINQNVGDTAGNTAKMADTLNMAEEDLQYMRDVAEREAINRYTTAEITIEQNNENHISSDMDLDGVIGYLNEGLEETINIAAEGEHW